MPEPILSIAEVRDLEERTWASGVTQESVIRRAGAAVAVAGLRLTGPNSPGAGPRRQGGITVRTPWSRRCISRIGTPSCSACMSMTLGSSNPAHQWIEQFQDRQDALIIDGLFGIGLARPVEGDWKRLIDAVNGSGLRVLSVDVPSGLNADTGEPLGVAVEASVTVTLGAVKKGLLLEHAARFVGRLELAP
jgi:NAD(P)H-hydrate repair Nnr-like enzyme with NAD(P)H-hydrate epimerase domain